MTYNQKGAEAFIKPKPLGPSGFMSPEEQMRYLVARGALTGTEAANAILNAPPAPRGVSVPQPLPLQPGQSPAHRLPVHPEVVQIADDLGPSRLGHDLIMRLMDVCMVPTPELTRQDKQDALAGLLHFLELADEGIALTAAGYMKPAVVRELAQVLPSLSGWDEMRRVNSEFNAWRLPWLRSVLRDFGLIRKYKGFIRTAKRGKALVGDPEGLWTFLKEALPNGKAGTGNRTIQWLYLINQALGDGGWEGAQERRQTMADIMNALGWRMGRGDDLFDEGSMRSFVVSIDLIFDNVGTGSDLFGDSRNAIAERLAAEIIRLDID